MQRLFKIKWTKLLSDITLFLGELQLPIVKILNPKAVIIPKVFDVVDHWTLGHSLTALVFYVGFMSVFQDYKLWQSILFSSFLSWLIMTLYEAWIDGRKAEDPRGASIRDLGANVLGIFLGVLATVAGHLLRTVL